jgi:hypothetical protein
MNALVFLASTAIRLISTISPLSDLSVRNALHFSSNKDLPLKDV